MTKGKKIAIISVGAVVIALVIAIIVLAVVQSTFFGPTVSNADEIRVWINGSEINIGVCTNPEVYEDENDPGQEIYTKIMEQMVKVSKESILTCVLAGAYDFSENVSEVETEISAIKENEVVIEFDFDETQTLSINKEEKKDAKGNLIKYDKIYVVVSDTKDLTEAYAYLYNKNDDKSEFRISYLAKQSELFDYVKGIDA